MKSLYEQLQFANEPLVLTASFPNLINKDVYEKITVKEPFERMLARVGEAANFTRITKLKAQILVFMEEAMRNETALGPLEDFVKPIVEALAKYGTAISCDFKVAEKHIALVTISVK